jgi:type I restriction enzyme M protein
MANDSISNKLWSTCNKMRQDPGTTGALQYVEQFSWLLFLKVYEEIENEYEAKATFEGKTYNRNIDNEYRWSVWTGKDVYITGPDLLEFVQTKLFPYLRKLSGNRTKEIIAEIFNNTQNRMEDGYLLREVVDVMAGVDFFGDEDSFAVSSIYEGLFARMKSSEIKPLAEFHTPRVIARFMTEMVAPKIGQTVYDPCNGPSGFLTEAYHFMRPQEKNTKDKDFLQKESFYGKELKALPFILGTMNMMLNGISTPNIRKMNTLSINLFNLTEKYDIILTNPPFSGTVRGIESNFPYPSAQTEILFLQHCLRSLNDGGKCAIVFPEGVLFENQDSSYTNTKKELLQNYNLHHIIRLPKGSFAPYTPINTNILFFDKTGPTKQIHFYDLPIPDGRKNFTKTSPITDVHFDEIKRLWDITETTDRSWVVDVNDVVKRNYSLDFRHPNQSSIVTLPNSKEIVELIRNSFSLMEGLFDEIEENLSRHIKCEYEEYSLGKLLIRRKEKIDIKDGQKYKRITVKMHGKGIVLRDQVSGNGIGTKKQFIVNSGHLLMSKIDARNGAFGIIPKDLEGAIITGNFWEYEVNTKLLYPDFFAFLTQTNSFLDFCIKSSRGATNRQYLEEKLFLAQVIKIPKDVDVQKKMVENINGLQNLSKKLIVHSDDYKKHIDSIVPIFLEKVFGAEI